MLFRLSADAVLLLHLAFIAFAVAGGALAIRWRWLPAVHLPAAAWAFFVELTGRVCPLTSLENHFRIKAGESGYPESFVEHYLMPVIYPSGLTTQAKLVLAGAVVLANLVIYAWVVARRRRAVHRPRCLQRARGGAQRKTGTQSY